jgi:Holliday junction DNA helicase RuvA
MPIARLRGTVEDKGDDWAIVAVGGLGVLAAVPSSTAEGLTVGQAALMYTHLHVREDALTLYGFSTREDLRLFEHLISVSGVGPRVALGLLSALDHAELAVAIVGGRSDVLRKVPGVGQKTAERIVLDLRDKVQPQAAGTEIPGRGKPAAEDARDRDVVSALVALGYSQAEASEAAARLPADEDAPLEDRVRMALGYFART